MVRHGPRLRLSTAASGAKMMRFVLCLLGLLWASPALAQGTCLGNMCPSGVVPDTAQANAIYVSGPITGLNVGINPLAPVAAATVTALPNNPTYNNGQAGLDATLIGTSDGALTIDGYAVLFGDRLLIKNQPLGYQNGVYQVTATGSLSAPYQLVRTIDAQLNNQLYHGVSTYVINGALNASAAFVLTTNAPITIGVTSLSFAQYAAGPTASGFVSGPTVAFEGDVPAYASATGKQLLDTGITSNYQKLYYPQDGFNTAGPGTPGLIVSDTGVNLASPFIGMTTGDPTTGDNLVTVTGTPSLDVGSQVGFNLAYNAQTAQIRYTIQSGDTTTSIAAGLSAAYKANSTIWGFFNTTAPDGVPTGNSNGTRGEVAQAASAAGNVFFFDEIYPMSLTSTITGVSSANVTITISTNSPSGHKYGLVPNPTFDWRRHVAGRTGLAGDFLEHFLWDGDDSSGNPQTYFTMSLQVANASPSSPIGIMQFVPGLGCPMQMTGTSTNAVLEGVGTCSLYFAGGANSPIDMGTAVNFFQGAAWPGSVSGEFSIIASSTGQPIFTGMPAVPSGSDIICQYPATGGVGLGGSCSLGFNGGASGSLSLEGSTSGAFLISAGATGAPIFSPFPSSGSNAAPVCQNTSSGAMFTGTCNAVGTWTPTDGSGAGLSLTVTDANYVVNGKICTVSASITYPTPIPSTANAQINGLPCTAKSGTNPVAGGAPSYTTYNTATTLALIQNSTQINFFSLAGAAIENTTIAGKQFTFTFTFITN
jgi:hypothetical protein